MADVTTQHPGYSGAVARWKRNRDAVAGRDAIAAGKEAYLPRPDQDKTPEADARYEAFIGRAQWYASPERTSASLVGAVFRKGPKLQELPEAIAYLAENANGAGASLEQMGKAMVADQIEVGGFGLLVDYPTHDLQNPTREQVAALGLRAKLAAYPVESIINWRTKEVAGRVQPVLIVLAEAEDVSADLFAHDTALRFRVLLLEDGRYIQRLYDEKGEILRQSEPVDADGKPWDTIPFVLAGAEENTLRAQKAPLAALCDCAISYWQVSALYHENLAIHGQLTLGVACDLDPEQWATANPHGLRVGAATGVFLGKGGAFHTATAPESSSLSKALQDKRAEMAELGAQIITKGSNAQTAEAARIDATAESSVLSHVVGNASEALEQALEWAARFMGADPEAVQFQLNTEFSDLSLDAPTRTALQGELDRGLIAKSDYRAALRRAGQIPAERTDEMIDEEVAAAPPKLGGPPLDLGDKGNGTS